MIRLKNKSKRKFTAVSLNSSRKLLSLDKLRQKCRNLDSEQKRYSSNKLKAQQIYAKKRSSC